MPLVTAVNELITAPYVDGNPRDTVEKFVSISDCEKKDFYEHRANCAFFYKFDIIV